jgi:hypothetical protein
MSKSKAMSDKDAQFQKYFRPAMPINKLAIIEDEDRHDAIVEEAQNDMYLSNLEDYIKDD